MDIFINEEKIDFKLENETTLHEVIKGLNSWAQKDGFHIQNIYFDGKEYTEAENGSQALDSVNELKVAVKNRFEIHQDNLQLLYQYVSLFIKSLESGNKQLLSELKGEAEPIMKLLSDFLEEKADSEDAVSSSLLKNIINLNPDNFQTDEPGFIALVRQLSGLKIILHERISEFGDSLGELSKTVTALKLSQAEINDISVLLQTGKDKEALNCIIRFSELSQKVLRLYPILSHSGYTVLENMIVDGKQFSEYYLDLNGILNELIEAFTANDSVLVGDLLEYEISPRLDGLINVLEDILEENLK